jgi:hypothetical protein
VVEYVKGCPPCQMNKPHRYKPKNPLHPVDPGPVPFQHIAVDLIAPLPESDGFNAILVIVDKSTKKTVFIPTNDTLTSQGFAELLIKHWIRHFGLPLTVTSDRGPQFVNKFIAAFYATCGITGTPSMAYHPQTDGQTERMNQELEIYLRFYVNGSHTDWSSLLPLAEFAYNDKIHSTTHISPHFALFGLHPWKGNPLAIPDAQNPAGADFGQRITDIRVKANEALRHAQDLAKAHYDRKRGVSWDFEIGDLVWLEGTNITQITGTKKLSPKRYGPFTIVDKHGSSSYKLNLPAAWSRLHPVFNEALLSPYREPATAEQALRHSPPPAIMIDGAQEYDVDSIVGFKFMRRRPFYKVRWKGYQPFDDTWEPLANLDHALDLVKAYHDSHPGLRRPTAVRFSASDSSPDVVLAIYPEHVATIVDGSKTHEFRKYRLSPDAKFLWLYETAPVCAVRFVIEVDNVALPGQIPSSGLGNAAFNTGDKESKFAYPILRLVRLPRPISASELLDFGLCPPHRWCPASPSFVLRFGSLAQRS